MKRSLALFAALALGACMGGGDKPKQPAPIPDSGPYVVDMDTGGGTKAYARRFDELKAAGTKVIIRNHAASSAAMFAYLPNACLEKSAVLRFHGPYDADGKPVLKDSSIVAARLLPGARAKYLAEWRHIKSGETMATLKRAQAIALDPALKRCEDVK